MLASSQKALSKLRGAFYTPQHLADYIVKWTVRQSEEVVLEPSCGDGVFIKALDNVGVGYSVDLTAIEIDEDEAGKSENRCRAFGIKKYDVFNEDFISWANKQSLLTNTGYSSVIGNPPYIKYQSLTTEFQKQAHALHNRLGLSFTKTTNSWVTFVLAAIELLKDNGRLGMVIPSEVIHVSHAHPLREYLEQTCSSILIIDPSEIWFEDTIQGAVILLAQKKNKPTDPSNGVVIKQVHGLSFLDTNPDVVYENGNKITQSMAMPKWTKALITADEWSVIKKITDNKHVHQFKDIATVKTSIITGANEYFILDEKTVSEYGLQAYAHPILRRSQYCSGVVFDKKQQQLNNKQSIPGYLLDFDGEFDELPDNVQQYILMGEAQNIHNRYKCRTRKNWYKVTCLYNSQLAMPKRHHSIPKMIFNEIEAYTTDTAYRVTSNLSPELITCCFLNPLTAIYIELKGRSYGNGVLEAVPSEIKEIFIPIPENFDYDISSLNEKVKHWDEELLMRFQGESIFKALGMNDNERDSLFNIWLKLKNRRCRIKPY